jgi:hypothetical protein
VQFIVSRGAGQSSEARKARVKGTGKVKTKVVDKRMKADMRGEKKAAAKKKGGKRGKR